jgi:hypothetical protein
MICINKTRKLYNPSPVVPDYPKVSLRVHLKTIYPIKFLRLFRLDKNPSWIKSILISIHAILSFQKHEVPVSSDPHEVKPTFSDSIETSQEI